MSVPYTPLPPSPEPKQESKESNDSKPQIAIAIDKPLEVVNSTATDVATTLSSLLSGSSTTLGTTGMGIFGTQLTPSAPRSTSVLVPPITIPTDPPPAAATPPLSSPLWRPFGPPEEMLTTTSSSGEKGASSVPEKADVSEVEPMVEDSVKKVTFEIAKTSEEKETCSDSKEMQETESEKFSSTEKLSDPNKVSPDPSHPEKASDPDKPANGDKSSEENKSSADKKDDNDDKEDKADSPYTSYLKDCCPHCGLYTHDDILGYDMLRATFRNWPCICTSVLGFNPFSYMESKEPFPAPSSIKTLDDFVTNMFVNCDSGLVVGITGTTTTEMNKALEKGVDIRPVIDADDNLEGMNEENVSLYVGVRYIRSVVRTLMLEHSRVKSSVAEVQLSREGRNRTSQLQMRSKVVQQTLKYVTIDTTSVYNVYCSFIVFLPCKCVLFSKFRLITNYSNYMYVCICVL